VVVGQGQDWADGPSGEAYTHATWNQQAGGMRHALGDLSAALEQMLASLTAKNASRAQVNGVIAWADQVRAAVTYGQTLIGAVNAAQRPVGEAIAAAGGPAGVADKSYYAEI